MLWWDMKVQRLRNFYNNTNLRMSLATIFDKLFIISRKLPFTFFEQKLFKEI